ncbi:MAG: RagB/SusD family nutrient uptake outer membrane protein [Flavobacteriaceae bacterium]|nr:RagB/SusD family nutrient uptake outer membrane protein [Flavobacteriaceae bacterium]
MSCSEDLLVERPPNFTTADALYTSVEGFDAGLNGLYSLARQERDGIKYTGGFGQIDLRAAIFLAGTDNIAHGSTGGLTSILADWSKSTSADPNIDFMFLWLYKVVSASNTIITRAENPDVDWGAGDDKERVLAEARTIRAWAYRHLTYLWGDVPLILEEITGENIITNVTREKIATVRAAIIEDLEFAEQYLPWLPDKAGRLTRGVAQTYLAEMYLAIGDPATSLIWSNKCINEGPYSLITSRYGAGASKPGSPFMDMFNPDNTNISAGNTEALWVMQWEQGSSAGGINLMRHESTMRYETVSYSGVKGFLTSTDERGGRGWSRQTILKDALLLYYALSDFSLGKIDQRGNDTAIRKYFIVSDSDNFSGVKNTATNQNWKVGDTVWLATPVSKKKVPDPGKRSLSGAYNFNLLPEDQDNENDWPYSLKFAHNDPGFPRTTESHIDQIYMRLAETILLRAEAKGRTGDLTGAASDINMLRDRANAKRVSAADFGGDMTTFLDYILDERSRELILEEQRRYTLLRMGGEKFFYRRVNNFNKITENLQMRDTLFPIPQSVIDANLSSVMPQNPGF